MVAKSKNNGPDGPARRAANDELLTTIANIVSGPNSDLQWLKEGKRLFPLLSRKAPLSSLTNMANTAAKNIFNKKQSQSVYQNFPRKRNKIGIHENKCNEKIPNILNAPSKIESCDQKNELQAQKHMCLNKNKLNQCTNKQEIIIDTTEESCINLNTLRKTLKKTENVCNVDNKILDKKLLLSMNVTTNSDENINVDATTKSINIQDVSKRRNSTTADERKPKLFSNNDGFKMLSGSNIFTINRKSSDNLQNYAETNQNKCVKHNNVEVLEENKNHGLVVEDMEIVPAKVRNPISVQKIINPVVIENLKVPTNIQLKDVQNRKAVKLITASNGKIFIQPAQGNTSRVANIRPLTTVIRPNQCIAIRNFTSLGNASNITSNSIKIRKANMLILPKTVSNKKNSETENFNNNLNFNKPNLSQSILEPLIEPVQSQSNVFVIGSILNQNITDDVKYKESNIQKKCGNFITEDTPVDILTTPISEVYGTEKSNTFKINTEKFINKTSFDDSQYEMENVNVFGATDWELELDQEVRKNREKEDNFNDVIEELVEEGAEDSFSEFEDSCQFEDVSGG